MLSCRSRGPFKIVEPAGTSDAPTARVISVHPTPADAFREIDRLTSVPGVATNDVELIVIDAAGVVVPRMAIR